MERCESDESEQGAGVMDTKFISPGLKEGSECEKSVFSYAPAEGNKPLSIFKISTVKT